MKRIIRALPALVLAGALTACGAPDPNDENHVNGMDKAMAFTLCKKNAERQLAAPATAKWQNVTSAEISKSDDGQQWGIRTHVDSDNALGATLRADVWCTVRPSDKDNAQVEAILL